MANTNAIVPNHGVGLFGSAGLAVVTVTCDSTYATATGGITLDISDVLTQLCIKGQGNIAHADVVTGWGSSAAGYQVCDFVVATSPNVTFRLFNGTSEHAETTSSQVVKLVLQIA